MDMSTIKFSVQCDDCAKDLEVAYTHYLSVGVAIQDKPCAYCMKALRDDLETQLNKQYEKGETR